MSVSLRASRDADQELFDAVSGNAALNGIPVQVRAAVAASA